MTGWPFLDESNYLEIGMNVMIGGSYNSDGSNDTIIFDSVTNKNDITTYKWNDAYQFDAPNFALFDGNRSNISMEFIKKDNEKQIDVSFKFAYFENNLNYDPFLYARVWGGSLNDNPNNDTNETVDRKIFIYLAIAIGALILVCCVLGAMCYRKKKRDSVKAMNNYQKL